MTLKALTDSQAAALYGETDPYFATGAVYPDVTNRSWGPDRNRLDYRILQLLAPLLALRVDEVEDNADAVYINPGRCFIGTTEYTDYAGETLDALTDDATTYIWAEDDGGGNLQINSGDSGGGWPATDHIKLAEVTMADGAITQIVDCRVFLANPGVPVT